MDDSKIDKALKRLECAELRVIIRGGKITKIPAQNIKCQERDGVFVVFEIPADITE